MIQSFEQRIQGISVFNALGERLLTKDDLDTYEEKIDVRFLNTQLLLIKVQFEEQTKILKVMKN